MQAIAKFLSPKASKDEPKRYYTPALQRSEKDENYNIDVLCMNCQGMININLIDRHSMSCFKVSEKVFQIENNISFDQIDYKLVKLKDALHNHTRPQTNTYGRPEENYAMQIIDYINQILSFQKKSDLKKIRSLKDLLNVIQNELENFHGPTSFLLYMERVKLLGKEKYKELVKQDQESIYNWKDNMNFDNDIKTNDPINTKNLSHVTTKSQYENNKSYGVYFEKPPHFSQKANISRDYSDALENGNSKYNSGSNSVSKTYSRVQNSSPHSSFLGLNLNNYTSSKGNEIIKQNLNRAYDNQIDSGNYTNSSSNYYMPNSRMAQPFDLSRRTGSPNHFNSSNYNNMTNSNISRDSGRKPIFGGDNLASPRLNLPLKQSGNYNFSSPDSKGDLNNVSYNSQNSSMKQQLETKLQASKKEYSEVTKQVEVYKKQTEDTQKSINLTLFGAPNPKLLSSPSATKNYTNPFRSDSPLSSKYSNPVSYADNREKNVYFDRSLASPDKFIRVKNSVVDDINSEIGGIKSSSRFSDSQETTSNLESISKGKGYIEEADFDGFDQQDKYSNLQDELQEEQRLFYSKCLAIKLKFKSKDLAQIVPVSLVYKEAMQNQIPQYQWDSFIENAFRYPEKYIDVKKLKKKSKHGLKNNLAEIAKTKMIPKKNKDLLQNIDVIYE